MHRVVALAGEGLNDANPTKRKILTQIRYNGGNIFTRGAGALMRLVIYKVNNSFLREVNDGSTGEPLQ